LVAFHDLLVSRTIANATEQVSEMPDLRSTARRDPEGHVRRRWKTSVSGEQVPLVTHPDELANVLMFSTGPLHRPI